MVASALTAAGLATTTTASAATATPTVTTATPTVVAAAIVTTTKITASNTNPAPNEPVTFTVTLKAGSTGLSKPVKIWHTLNGVRYADGTHNTVNGAYKFTQAFGSKGQRVYHAEFASGSSYAASAGTVTVNVGTKTTTTLTASKTNPIVLEKVTFTAQLKRFDTKAVLANRPVTIWHYFNGVRYDDIKNKLTDSSGKVAISQSFGSPSFSSSGVRTYYATFAGDTSYAKSQSSAVKIYVVQPTTLTIRSNVQETTGLTFQIEGTLTTGNEPLANQGVTVRAYDLNTKEFIFLGKPVTNANGAYSLSASVPRAGDYVCQAAFVVSRTDAIYSSSASGDMLLYAGITTQKLPMPTDLTLFASPTQTPKVNSAFTLSGFLYSGDNTLVRREVTLDYKYRASPSQPWSSGFKEIAKQYTHVYPDAEAGYYGFRVSLSKPGWYMFMTSVGNYGSTYLYSYSNRMEVVAT